MEEGYRGGCRRGAVRYEVRGAPQTMGLCHCADCRRETGSTFLYYADWPLDRFTQTGQFATWEGRSFCSMCGRPVFHLSEDHAGSLDEVPAAFVPTREG